MLQLLHRSNNAIIVEQAHSLPNTTNVEQLSIRKEAIKVRKHRPAQLAAKLKHHLPVKMYRAMNPSTKKGSSNWLSTLPIAEYGFALHKSASHDALFLS